MKYRILTINVLFLALLSSCDSDKGNKSRAAIKLGDSATIITETDSQYLRDEVMDMEPPPRTEAAPEVKEEPVKPAKDTATAAKAEPAKVSGYTIDFGEAKMVLAGLNASEARKQNPQRDNGLTYVVKGDDIANGKVVFYGVKNVSVKQRYQSRLMLVSSMGRVDLRDLGLYTSGWSNLPAAGAQTFALNNLANPDFVQVNNNKITNATDRELRKRRTNKRVLQSWMKEIRNVRNAKDKPCDVILDNVQWQVSGTDAKGKAFQKTIRIDV